jgi:recombination protein RecA
VSDPRGSVRPGSREGSGDGLDRAVARWAREKRVETIKEASRMDTDRDKMLDVALAQIEKQFGRGAVMKLGEHPMGAGISVIPTGSLALDIALGVGGIPRGRIVEVFGPEGSGKTTVCLHIIAEAQRHGGIAAFVDAEHALDPTYAQRLGVNIDELLVSQPDSGEQALEIADLLVRSGALDCVVIDSVAALVPRAEIEGEMGDTHVGLQARLMSQAMRKLAGTLSRFDTTAIFINQLREKIGVMFGSPETTPGGRALKFYSSVRLDVRKIENLKDGTEVVGSRTRVKVVKNKVAPPFRQCEFDIMYGQGVSKEGSLLDVGVDLEIVKKSGAWFTYEGDQLGQGRENARQFLAEHTDVAEELERRVREAVGLTAFGAEGDETPVLAVPDADLESVDAPKAGKKEREATGARAG